MTTALDAYNSSTASDNLPYEELVKRHVVCHRPIGTPLIGSKDVSPGSLCTRGREVRQADRTDAPRAGVGGENPAHSGRGGQLHCDMGRRQSCWMLQDSHAKFNISDYGKAIIDVFPSAGALE